MKRLANKVAIVTGAARGLGASIVRLFHREGAQVVLADTRDAEGQALAEALGGRAKYVHLDVSNEQEWFAAIEATRAHFGLPTVLVNNAGIYRTTALVETSVDEYLQIIRINQLGCFLGMRCCVEAMREAGGGSIVNVGSTAGIEGVGGALAYTASKHAVVGMTKAAALELGGFGVRVNVVCPGAMATPMLAESFHMPVSALATQQMDNSPLQRMGSPDEIAAAVLFLASPESSYATGCSFVIDGGVTAGIMGASAPAVQSASA